MNPSKKRLAIAIDTANGWSSDSQYGAVSLLSLGTTRTIHSESHRFECLKCIAAALAWNRTYTPSGPDDVNQPTRDILRLEDLEELVVWMPIGKEWMTFDEYSRVNEYLYQRGEV